MSSRNASLGLGNRIRKVRRELYGEEGVTKIAELLEVPDRTWENYEQGVNMPAVVILKFLALTRVDANWLLSGVGDPYAGSSESFDSQNSG